MICPYCGLELEEFDEPDEAVRAYCCECNIMVTIHELNDRTICPEEEEEEDKEN
jgi:hypothetical protein